MVGFMGCEDDVLPIVERIVARPTSIPYTAQSQPGIVRLFTSRLTMIDFTNHVEKLKSLLSDTKTDSESKVALPLPLRIDRCIHGWPRHSVLDMDPVVHQL